jgi:molecular chaperone IbpA
MRSYDLSPLFRTSVGFDRLNKILDAAQGVDSSTGYPPYNIEKLEQDRYGITMAVAGFAERDLDVTVKDNVLVVTGRIEPKDGKDGFFLHRGIATRAFERRFQLADHIEVVNARLENGLLDLDLVREVPESLKPRKIAIGNGSDTAPLIETEKAA